MLPVQTFAGGLAPRCPQQSHEETLYTAGDGLSQDAIRVETACTQLPATRHDPTHREKLFRWKASGSRVAMSDMLRQALAKWGAPPGEPPPSTAPVSLGSGLDAWQVLGSGATTLMVRNLPATCQLSDLLQDWPLDGSYDFLYLPLSTSGRYAMGYAFINFVSVPHAQAFISRWQSERLSRFQDERRVRLAIAEKQGLEANIDKLKAKSRGRLQSLKSSLLIVKGGRLLSFEDL